MFVTGVEASTVDAKEGKEGRGAPKAKVLLLLTFCWILDYHLIVFNLLVTCN